MGVLCPEEKADASSRPWVPRSQKQMGMSAQEVEIDNYCREVMTILNKVTPQNVDVLLDKLANLDLNSEFYIEKLVKYIVCKAESEPLYCELYAEMCCTLNQVVDRYISARTAPSISITNSVTDVTSRSIGIFKELIVNECNLAFDGVFNTDFYKSDSSQDDAFILHEHRQKTFGAMQFIGQLYNVNFLQDDVMHKMITRLLNDDNKTLLEFQIECLCRLLRAVGATMESHGRKASMEQIFQELNKLSLGNAFCSRVKFGVLDIVELRQNNWVCRRLVETPMTIDELRTTYVNPVIVKRKKKKKKQKN